MSSAIILTKYGIEFILLLYLVLSGKKTERAIDWCINQVGGNRRKIFVGGIAASLMHERYKSIAKWEGVRFIKGLLDRPPTDSLELTSFDGPEASEILAKAIEDYPPYYEWLTSEDRDDLYPYRYPVEDAYIGYASRGCVRKCQFCGVPTLEGDQKVIKSIKGWVGQIERSSGVKKDLLLMDNNVTAAPNYKDIIAEIRDLGFQKGSVIENPKTGRMRKRRVDFNQGVDARILVKSPMYLKEMATIAIQPLRIAFDHAGMKKVYSQATRMAAESGINEISNYMLYNFRDGPEDLYSRIRINRDLNEELKINIWSFPMRYQPITHIDRSFVGPKWTWYELRAFQIMLQVTHGAVSGSPGYFEYAYGEDVQSFRELLLRPFDLIWNRKFYDTEGMATKNEFENSWKKLSKNEYTELLEIIGKDVGQTKLRSNISDAIIDVKTSNKVKNILEFYMLEKKMPKTKINKEIKEKIDDGIAIEDAGIHIDQLSLEI